MPKVSTAPIDIERQMFYAGKFYCIGFDEAGRGAIAGPLHVGWAVLPLVNALTVNNSDKYLRQMHVDFEGVRDSKKFRDSKTKTAHEKRLEVLNRVRGDLISGGSVHISAQRLDAVGLAVGVHGLIDSALDKALADIRQLAEIGSPEPTPDNVWLLCDNGLFPDLQETYDGQELEKGETYSLSIAVASLFAKTDRDAYMADLDTRYPEYGFADHKGYYAYDKPHMEDAHRLGIIREYRRSFAPIKNWIAEGSVEFKD